MSTTPALQNVSIEYQSYTGVPKIKNFFYDASRLKLNGYTKFGTQDQIQFYCGVDGNPDFLWDFGDGIFSTEKNAVHAYLIAGTYTVSLTVTNEYGTDTLTKVNYLTIVNSYPTINNVWFEWTDPEDPIPIYPKLRNVWFEYGNLLIAPTADFGTAKRKYVLGKSTTFINLSTDNPETFLWDFGDGNTSTDKNPTHTYTDLGSYTVSLTVTNEYGENTTVKTDYIKITNFGLNPIFMFSGL